MSDSNKKPDFNVYMVTGTADKPFYTKIGAVWKNKADGFGGNLDAYPANGRIVLFPYKEKDDGKE